MPNHTLRKKIRHQALNWITFLLVAVNLIPIAWMAWCGFKDNNEILSGTVLPGRRANDIILLARAGEGYLAGAADGGIVLLDGRDLSVRKQARLGTFATSYYLEPGAAEGRGGSLWALSSNKGLLEIDPADLGIRATYGPELLAGAYGDAWRTLWVNDVRGSSLAGAGGFLYLSFDFKDYPGITAFSLADRAFRKVEAFAPKEMGTVRQLTAVGRLGADSSAGAAGAGNLAILTRQGLSFLDLAAGRLGRTLYPGGGLPETPDRVVPAGDSLLLASLGDRACLYDPLRDSVRAWIPLEAAGHSKVSSLALGAGSLWMGNSQAALALPLGAAGAADSLRAAAARLFRPEARGPAAAGAGAGELSGYKVSAILPLEGGGALLGGPRGSVALLDAGGLTLASGSAPPAPFNFQWRNYVDLWRNVDFGLYLKNSLIICLSVMVIAVVMASLGGYALARFRFPGKNMFGYSILATQMIPGIMLLLPVYLMFVNFTQATGIILKGTYGGLILTYAAYFVPFSIWILRGFFASIPKELEEAALIDGCGPFKAFFRIIIPSAMPGIVATGVYVFLAAWDELMFAWVLTNESTYTIPVGIRLFVGNFQNRYDLMMAAATVSTIPVMIIFFVLQRQIVSGLTAGAVKD